MWHAHVLGEPLAQGDDESEGPGLVQHVFDEDRDGRDTAPAEEAGPDGARAQGTSRSTSSATPSP